MLAARPDPITDTLPKTAPSEFLCTLRATESTIKRNQSIAAMIIQSILSYTAKARCLPILFLLSLLAACSSTRQMYEGEARAREDVALLTVKQASFGASFVRGLTSDFKKSSTPDQNWFVSVNGVKAGRGVDSVEVLPGPQTVLIQGLSLGSVRYSKGPDKLVFNAVAGGVYTISSVPGITHTAWDFMLTIDGMRIRSMPVPD